MQSLGKIKINISKSEKKYLKYLLHKRSRRYKKKSKIYENESKSN